MKNFFRVTILLIVFFTAVCMANTRVYASDILSIPDINVSVGGTNEDGTGTSSLQLLLLITVISLAPYILIMLTSFTRIIIVLHFVRTALGTQQMPPNQVLIGLALFLTLFLMSPAFSQINETALQPLAAGEITQQEAIDNGLLPLREFMLGQVETQHVQLFVNLSGRTDVTPENMPYTILIPSFILGEISKGFRFGFVIYLPFIVVDMVVASTLMAMGMMMLPPAMISLPFKMLLFVLLDGWKLILEMLMTTF